MSGASLEDVEKATRKMSVGIAEAAAGSATAQAELAALGLTAERLQGLSPDQQFAAIADTLAMIADPGAKAAAAMNIFGKSGTNLIPMLNGGSKGIADMMKEAEALGLVMSGQDASAAAKLDDVLDQLWGTIESVKNAIGASLAPVLTQLGENFIAGIGIVRNFINDHRELVVQFARITAIVTAVGGSIVAIGGIRFSRRYRIRSTAVMGAITGTVAFIGGALLGLAMTTDRC